MGRKGGGGGGYIALPSVRRAPKLAVCWFTYRLSLSPHLSLPPRRGGGGGEGGRERADQRGGGGGLEIRR